MNKIDQYPEFSFLTYRKSDYVDFPPQWVNHLVNIGKLSAHILLRPCLFVGLNNCLSSVSSYERLFARVTSTFTCRLNPYPQS